MAQRMPKDIREATVAGAQAILDEFSGNQSVAGEACAKRGIKLDQRTFSDVLRRKPPKVGVEVAQRVAAYHRTTLQGLVDMFGPNKGRALMRVGDVIGWDEAVAEARRKHPAAAERMPWDLAAMVRLPVAPDEATSEFAYDVADLLMKHSEITVVRKRRNG